MRYDLFLFVHVQLMQPILQFFYACNNNAFWYENAVAGTFCVLEELTVMSQGKVDLQQCVWS